MFRVTPLTKMDDRQLNRLIKRVVLLLAVGTIAFVGFYALDRWRPATEPIVDRRLSAAEQAVRLSSARSSRWSTPYAMPSRWSDVRRYTSANAARSCSATRASRRASSSDRGLSPVATMTTYAAGARADAARFIFGPGPCGVRPRCRPRRAPS